MTNAEEKLIQKFEKQITAKILKKQTPSEQQKGYIRILAEQRHSTNRILVLIESIVDKMRGHFESHPY